MLIIFSFLFAAIVFARENSAETPAEPTGVGGGYSPVTTDKIELPAVSPSASPEDVGVSAGGGSAFGGELPKPGLTPDSPFYFLKSWKESIQTFFTFGAENKAKQFLHLAEVRLAEYQKMIEKGKTEIAEKTLEKYGRQLNQAIEKAEEVQKKEGSGGVMDAIEERRTKHQRVFTEVLAKVSEETKQEITEKRNEKWTEFITEVKEKFPELISGPVEPKDIPVQALFGCPVPFVPRPENCEGGWFLNQGFLNQVSSCPYFSCLGASKKQTQEPPKPIESSKRIELEKPIESPVCIQVITPAIGPDNKCKEFPTPCEVPSGWKKVDKCPVKAQIAVQCQQYQFDTRPCPDSGSKRVYNCNCVEGKWSCPALETACPKPSEIRYYTCLDGTKVVSGECYGEGETLSCAIKISPELQCPAQTSPVTAGAECPIFQEIKYYTCPDGTQKIWCWCSPEGSFAGAKNKWQCQHIPVGFTCAKQTVTPTPTPIPTPTPTPTETGIACCVQEGKVCKVFPEGDAADNYNESKEQCRKEGWLTGASSCSPNPCQPFSLSTNLMTPTAEDVPCRTEQPKDYKCPDGTLIKWQCKCRFIDGEVKRHCIVNPAELCSSSVNSAPLAINWIWTRYLTWVSHVFWTTNKPATSWIEYGPTAAYGSETPLSPFSPNYNHNVAGFSGQQLNTTYHFRIIAEDAQGHKIVSDDYTFTSGL